MNAKVIPFQSSEQLPSLALCKVETLDVLAEVEANAPTCCIRKPVDVLEIYTHCGCYGPLTIWILAAFALEREGLVRTWSNLGKTFIELTDKGKRGLLGVEAEESNDSSSMVFRGAGNRHDSSGPASSSGQLGMVRSAWSDMSDRTITSFEGAENRRLDADNSGGGTQREISPCAAELHGPLQDSCGAAGTGEGCGQQFQRKADSGELKLANTLCPPAGIRTIKTIACELGGKQMEALRQEYQPDWRDEAGTDAPAERELWRNR